MNFCCTANITLICSRFPTYSGEGKEHTLPTSAGMFIELVAKPIPKVMEDSTPRKLATSFSKSSWIFRFPTRQRSRDKITVSVSLSRCLVFPGLCWSLLFNHKFWQRWMPPDKKARGPQTKAQTTSTQCLRLPLSEDFKRFIKIQGLVNL